MSKIFFYNVDVTLTLRHKADWKVFIENLFKYENYSLKKLDYIFCSDNYLHDINQRYLEHNTLTDVITFRFSYIDEPICGEIYISTERVKENATTYKVSKHNELLRVMIHGALHLCGYQDKTKYSKMKMRKKEDFYLNNFKVPREAGF